MNETKNGTKRNGTTNGTPNETLRRNEKRKAEGDERQFPATGARQKTRTTERGLDKNGNENDGMRR